MVISSKQDMNLRMLALEIWKGNLRIGESVGHQFLKAVKDPITALQVTLHACTLCKELFSLCIEKKCKRPYVKLIAETL